MKDSFLDGRYENLGSLGEGGYSRVILARHAELGYVRALKIQDRMVDGEDDPLYAKFKEECATLLRLGNGCHQNIVRMYQFGLLNGHAFAEMDYVDGISLYDYMKESQDTGLPWEEVFRLSTDIASALAYCHVDIYKYLMDREKDNLESDPDDGQKILISEEKKYELIRKYRIIHNNVHSNNVMRRHYDGHYVLLDFGLCIQGQTKAGVRSSQRKNGACEYVSPEKSSRILNGTEEHNVEVLPQEDVYSWGIIIYEAVSGRPPFYMHNDNDSERLRILKGHLNVDADELVTQLKQKRSNTPEWLCNVLKKCLQKDSKQRYQDARQLLADVNEGIQRQRLEETQKTTEELYEAIEERERTIKNLMDVNEELKKTRKEGIRKETVKNNEAIEKRNKIISHLENEVQRLNSINTELKRNTDSSIAIVDKQPVGRLSSLIIALSFAGCFPAAYTCFQHALWVPTVLFLGLTAVSVYIHFNSKEQGSIFLKTVSVIQLITFSLMAVTVYKTLQQQQPGISVYLAVGAISIMASVFMNFIKPSNKNKNEKTGRIEK